MTPTIYFLFIAIICFLYTLNLFLRGSKKQQIEAALGILIALSVIASFFIFNWRWGLIYLIFPFIFVGLFRPIAESIAYRLLGYRTGVDDQSEAMDNLLEQMAGGEEGFKKALEKIDIEVEKNRQRLSSIANKVVISSVLEKHNVSFDAYEKLFNDLWSSALQDLAWEIVSTPSDLDSLIQMKKQGVSGDVIWYRFRNFK